MMRGHTIRLNPTPEQVAYFRRAVGTRRFVFNWGLAVVKQALDSGQKPPSVFDLKKQFNAIKGQLFPWVYDVTKCAVEGGFRNLQTTLSNFWQSKQGRRKGQRMGFPRFKSRKHESGSLYLANDKVAFDGYWVSIPGLGKVNMTEPLRFAGKMISATVSYRAGWWWLAVQADVSHTPPVHCGHPVGVDVGVNDLVVDSDGQRFENQKALRIAIRRVKRLQRCVSRRKKGGRNRAKAILRLAREHYRVACRRQDALHKATTAIARKAAFIGLEDLNVIGMVKNHRLALSLSDAALGELHRQLHYRAD